jgi:hypothetical protein
MADIEFKAGDKVVLSGGPYFGNTGVFVRLLEEDSNWAAITERTSLIRKHPLVWLRHASHEKRV